MGDEKMNEQSRYELFINTSSKAMQSMCIVAIFISAIVIYINKLYDINRIWNICFLLPMYFVYFSCVIQNILCFWKISNKNIIKSSLFFSTCITFLVFIGIFFIYIVMSIILFN